MGKREEIKRNRIYWEKILGPDVCELAQKEEEPLVWPEAYRKEYMEAGDTLLQVLKEAEGWKDYGMDAPFGNFYRVFGRTAVTYAKGKRLRMLVNRKETILTNVYKKIEWIPLRVLIGDIHRCKEAGLLRGKNSEEEYEDYCQRFLGNRSYVGEVCDRYPEMTKLLLMQIVHQVLFLEEIVSAAQKDKPEIEKRFFRGEKFTAIEGIICGQSDSHRQGRTVAMVFFDHGRQLVYKPRSLGKESCFEELYQLFCEQAGLSYEKIPAVDCGEYGWQFFVGKRACRTQTEVKRYFERMGILLFLCYCMNAADVHGENIIADGEYPRFIDLEAFPGVWCPERPDHAEALVREELKRSVLSTGILPVPMWQQEGQGVIISVLHGTKREQTPFQIPVLCSPRSSDVHIGYRRGEVTLSESMPCYEGGEINPADFVKEICTGFQSAYVFRMSHRENLKEQFEKIFSFRSRYLLRHTQQYSMLLQTSFHPDFLENMDRRRLFFHVLDARSTRERKPEQFLEYERNALYQMDIPLFYTKGDSRSVYNGADREYPDALKTSVYAGWKEKQSFMGESDLKKQLRLIELSLALLAEHQTEGPKPGKSSRPRPTEADKTALIGKIADKVCSLAVVYEEKDINFCGLGFREEGSWRIAPMGMYLYDGIAGVAVFMAAVWKQNPAPEYGRIYRLLIRKLFRYTETLENHGMAESEHIGAFIGEGSLVHAYLLLYKITGDDLFLEYAKRHALLVAERMDKEKSMDLLSGCAGAIVVLMKLYRIVRKDDYLAYAQKLEEKLWRHVERMEEGCGWRMTEEGEPLAGLAHGNSGLLLAYAYLMEAAPKPCYIERIHELLRYENSLYEEAEENWRDLRHANGERTSSNAWCHGASGILLSRLRLKALEPLKNDPQMERDIERCRKIFLKGRETQEICLCHGLAGDYLVLELYAKGHKDAEMEEAREEVLVRLLEKMEKEELLKVQERESISMMAGMTGVGIALFEENYKFELLW